ncbi:MAG: glycosyltransferase family 2 protein, partial [Dehalococcoidia bacterium]|nr:glycosyltransferase family 2 protein [Dehalococcoidia bacterium]
MAVALDISIVICAYTEKRWEETVAAVESIKNQSTPATQIIVVIDHNRALLLRAIRNISGVVIVENRKQRGLSGARNTGVEMAIGEIVGFIDDDASAAEDWLERIGAGYADQSVIGVGGAVEPIWHNARPKWFPEEFDWVVGCSYRGMPSSAATIRNPLGCNMTFRRSVFELVGGFREDIGRVGTLPVGCE